MENLGKADWSDPERVRGLTESYNMRYGEQFWNAFNSVIGEATIRSVVEFGCGPGLFLVDSVRRLGAEYVLGIDESNEMLDHARTALKTVLADDRFQLMSRNLDRDEIPASLSGRFNLAFSGYLLHEVSRPTDLLRLSQRLLVENGISIAFDFVAGDLTAFVRLMAERGMSEERARARYPHMCRHSVADIESLMRSAGLSSVRHVMVDAVRAIVVGVKNDDVSIDDGSVHDVHEHLKSSPWAYNESDLRCPKCNSTHIGRVIDSHILQQGIQVFECFSCGKKFYERGVDDYRPTY